MNKADTTILMGVGDIILGAPNNTIDSFFDNCRDTLKEGDIVIGNMETPATKRPMWSNSEPHSAMAVNPDNLPAMARAGFNVATIGGNHCFDQGAYGILDAIDVLTKNGISVCGAGRDIDEARKPAIIPKKNIEFAFLHYNLTGPRECYAAPCKVGCAYVRIATAYCNDRAEPGGSPSSIYTIADPHNRQDMIDDIEAAKKAADNVIIYFHSGRPGSPDLLQYEIELTHHCIDVGVQMVLCCHTHALSSVEIYKGKPIFYGLGNFVTVLNDMNPDAPNAKQRRFDPYGWPGVTPFWEFDVFKSIRPEGIPYYPFSEFSRNTCIAKAQFNKEGIVGAGIIPCYINDKAQPTPVTRSGKGDDVINYLEDWTRRAGLDTSFIWNEEGTEVLLKLD